MKVFLLGLLFLGARSQLGYPFMRYGFFYGANGMGLAQPSFFQPPFPLFSQGDFPFSISSNVYDYKVPAKQVRTPWNQFNIPNNFSRTGLYGMPGYGHMPFGQHPFMYPQSMINPYLGGMFNPYNPMNPFIGHAPHAWRAAAYSNIPAANNDIVPPSSVFGLTRKLVDQKEESEQRNQKNVL